MSCATQSSQPIRLTVSVGNLPEGYCPANFQQFANDFAARLIVTPNQNNSTFVTGSVEPTSNVGPWLKDCLQWFFFDDATGRYRIQTKGGFDSVEVFNSSGTFVVPDNIFKIRVEAWGGGGGGGNTSSAPGGGGGGGGGYGSAIFNVTPAQAITVTVGGSGAGGAPGVAGGASTVLTMTAGGGAGGATGAGSGGAGGAGGVTTGATIPVNGQYGATSDSILGQGHGGTGGDSPSGGGGGRASATAADTAGVTPGGGGAGGTNALVAAGGAGGAGRVVIYY